MKAIILSVVSVCFLFFQAVADSPLTSTPFWEVYKNEKIITEAKLADGVLTNQLTDFLVSGKNKIDLKMAVINCLSWDFNGKKNAQIFVNRLIEKGIYKNSTDFKTNGSADHLLCMAYLKAMDDYFDVTEAYEWAELALLKNDWSYTFSIIHSLIHAQILFDSDWCLVWLTAYAVQQNTSLKQDMKPEAVIIIFDYMNLYSEYCK
jgi:hypothetical protein